MAKINICESSIRLLKSLGRCWLWNFKIFLKICREIFKYQPFYDFSSVPKVMEYGSQIKDCERNRKTLNIKHFSRKTDVVSSYSFQNPFIWDPYSIIFNFLSDSFCKSFKVQLFWEGHKKIVPSSSWFGHLLSKRPNHEEDFFKLCVFLRKSES